MSEHPGACPACDGTTLIRSGHACGRQRWRCKGCGRQFTRTTPRGKPEAMRREAVGLYCAGLSLSADQLVRIDAILPAGWAHGARYGTAMAQGPEGWA